MSRTLTRLFRSRPKTAILLLSLVPLLAAGAGLHVYALLQWRAAQAAVKEGRTADAQSNLKVCLFVWPRSGRVHLLAARTARLRGDFDGAEAHLDRCLKLDEDAAADAELEFLLVRLQRGEVDAVAPALLQHVENKNPQSSSILEILSQSYMQMFRHGSALACLDRWIQEAPDAAEAYHLRGRVLERLEDRASAMKDYRRAIELNPDLDLARLRLAEMYLLRSEPQEALPHLQRLRLQSSNRPDVLARLGRCRLLQGRVEEARDLLEAAVEKLPGDPDLLVQLAKVEVLDDRPRRAEKMLRQVLEADATNTEAQFVLIASLRQQNRMEEAEAAEAKYWKDSASMKRVERTLQEGARQPIQDAGALCEVGSVFLRAGRDRLGLYWLHQALARDPRHHPTHQTLSEYYQRKGEVKKAAAHRLQAACPPCIAVPAGAATLGPRSFRSSY